MSTDVEDFLEHYGVKGQKWGVRRTRRIQGRIDRIQRQATGTASRGDRVRNAAVSAVITRRGAGRVLRRADRMQQSIETGDNFVADLFLRTQGIRIQDLNYYQRD